jgi:hypothetical protein
MGEGDPDHGLTVENVPRGNVRRPYAWAVNGRVKCTAVTDLSPREANHYANDLRAAAAIAEGQRRGEGRQGP